MHFEKARGRDPLIILDCDGVLIESESLAARVEIEELSRLGCSISVERYLERVLGRTEDEVVWSEIAAGFGVCLPEDFAEKTRASVAEVFELELEAIPGVKYALGRLPFSMCVASGSRPERLLRSLELTGLSRFFKGNIFSATAVPKGKPHPDLFIYAASRMGVGPQDCIVVEDSETGVQAGVSAGMTVLGFFGARHCSPGHAKKLVDAGCHVVFDKMIDLPDLCKRIL